MHLQRIMSPNKYLYWKKLKVALQSNRTSKRRFWRKIRYHPNFVFHHSSVIIAIANDVYFQGNEYFKEGKFEAAIKCYSNAIQLDTSDAVLPANRSIAFLKMNKYLYLNKKNNTLNWMCYFYKNLFFKVCRS